MKRKKNCDAFLPEFFRDKGVEVGKTVPCRSVETPKHFYLLSFCLRSMALK